MSNRTRRVPSPPLPPLPPRPETEPIPNDPPIPFPEYSIEVTPPPYTEVDENPAFSVTWDGDQSGTPQAARPRVLSTGLSAATLSRTRSAGATTSGSYMPFPEPQIYPSTAYPPAPPLTRARSHSHLGASPPVGLRHQSSTSSFRSTASSYNQEDNHDRYGSGYQEHNHGADGLSRELSNLSLDAEESLRRFQAGELPENDQVWHRLVPPEARDALGKQEVQRQSVLFEVFKSEREYVEDLQTVQEVFIQGLRTASPPIIPPEYLQTYIKEVFGNLDIILAQHKRMLAALFARQREQHPLVQSVADIILDAVLGSEFRSAYETYIKHYPLSEDYHRTEQKRNPAYRKFVQSVSTNPGIRKRDLVTFLSRPVTRLPRLSLLLEQILKLTDQEYKHPDLETLPITLGILGDFIKSTQPGIEVAEGKVKFWALCESLQYQSGEIIDLDLDDESRTLVYSGPLARQVRSDSGWSSQSWMELTGSLLDNYFLLTRDEKRLDGTIKRHLVSRPLPLSYLRLGSFTDPPETRREKPEDGRLLDSFRSSTVTVYPFTIYHASSRSTRRYTFYVASEGIRKRWHSVLVDAIAVHKARQEGNMWFYQRSLTDRFFRVMGPKVPYGSNIRLSGRVTSAVSFMSGGRKFIAVGCQTGIYVSAWGVEEYRRVFNYSNPTAMAAIRTVGPRVYNKFIVQSEGSLLAYSLDVVAQAALGKVQSSRAIGDSMERLAKHDQVVFFKHLSVGQWQLIMYGFQSPQPTSNPGSKNSFKPFGDPGYVPRDAFDISPLLRTVGICSKEGIVILDPTNLTSSKHLLVPDLRDAPTNPSVNGLKSRLEGARPLGLVPLPGNPHRKENEILVVYDLVGCYVTRQGVPSRAAGIIKWETKATSFAQRGSHVFLFSPQFIEIRNITIGVIVQVIEGADIRLLHAGPTYGEDEDILMAMRGSKDDKDGTSENIVELAGTSAIPTPTPIARTPSVWDEWDM
ncbi:putative CNH domain containing protein [Lyophyllum shimeji]|uniref:CNH domain containing protein n=1 Tax=Lyophyllum shimeji TaxID=47721 RepID=A0A9P3UQP9_LYOSH|nr:putative CNH domain containing protein [Lyophyllum shimeji]